MINQLRAELYLVPRTGVVPIALLAATVCAVLYTWLQGRLADGSLGPEAASGVSGLSDILILSLLIPLVLGSLIARGFQTRSIHASIQAAGRTRAVLASALVALAAALLLTVPYGAAALVARAMDMELQPAIPTAIALLGADTSPLDGSTLAGAIAVALVSGLVMVAKLSVVVPLAVRFPKPLLVMTVGIVWGFLADLIGGQLEDVSGLGAALALTPFHSRYMPLPDSPAGELASAAAVSLVFIAAMCALAALLMRRRDVD